MNKNNLKVFRNFGYNRDERSGFFNLKLVFVVEFYRFFSFLLHGASLRQGCPVSL